MEANIQIVVPNILPRQRTPVPTKQVIEWAWERDSLISIINNNTINV
jgi:hypothetical protein